MSANAPAQDDCVGGRRDEDALSPTGDPVRTRARATTQNTINQDHSEAGPEEDEPHSIHPTASASHEPNCSEPSASLASTFCPLPAANAAANAG